MNTATEYAAYIVTITPKFAAWNQHTDTTIVRAKTRADAIRRVRDTMRDSGNMDRHNPFTFTARKA